MSHQHEPSPSLALLSPPNAPPQTILHGYTSDVFTEYDFDRTGVIVDIKKPAAAVALTGVLLPGMFACVTPAERRQTLATVAALSVNRQQWFGGQPTADLNNNDIVRLPPEVLAIYPGDVVPLGRLSTDGIAVHIPSPRYQGSASNTNIRVRPEPYIRVFGSTDGLPSRIGYRPTPLWFRTPAAAAAPAAGTVPGGVAGSSQLSSVTHVRIIFQDNVGTNTPIQGAETATFDVWWQDASGLWLHHQDDDFDAAGRGAALATHNAETYAIQPGIVGVQVVATGGDTFFVDFVAFDAQAAYR